jgi:hypothetical protein
LPIIIFLSFSLHTHLQNVRNSEHICKLEVFCFLSNSPPRDVQWKEERAWREEREGKGKE